MPLEISMVHSVTIVLMVTKKWAYDKFIAQKLICTKFFDGWEGENEQSFSILKEKWKRQKVEE